ncbi:DUF84 family protein [Alkalicoccobacillus murimartini]|uniref:inosine/xanthosine triphosphatase n=1 Tax=Alkalicoccobacillus murimartini TaxID=171685 RepID=A0ABT9YJY4_9BACI|nr:DUF84 family protein [Alkalicoccobacillus murimartini]MDQ0208165.1 inosine/xanthosine triphosphatase [Alkalicoccobacillus murimartini]
MSNEKSYQVLAIGTKNPAKVHAVQEPLIRELFEFITVDAPSGVSCQPFSDEETRQGAINRAKAALMEANADLGIGLEGGVSETDSGSLLLCNWGALVDSKGRVWEASGLRIPVPADVSVALSRGQELGTIMDEHKNEEGTNTREGAVGLFTANWVSRKDMFSQIVKALYGQYLLSK